MDSWRAAFVNNRKESGNFAEKTQGKLEKKDEYTKHSHGNSSQARKGIAGFDERRVRGLPRGVGRSTRRSSEGDRCAAQKGTSGGSKEGDTGSDRRARGKLHSRGRKDRRACRDQLRV